ncbi:hypothetical protein C8A01DRAFT_44499 [Parachaetomium inaequale]|uniref:Uncharacterized protein n=1 Tax=Parachaetomium inaequale TaxID=2588326 RepID=A0AAN6SUD8_9PEZI|nr:hypothetical protein C8A01DRAFT_44499 [Parachaetomium inaequale]
MLCGIRSTSNHHHHSLLRSFRSHRSLRHPKNSQESLSSEEEEMHHHHRHLPSDASSLARPSLDSTSSRRTDMSIDWDPLRLHPSVAAGPSPPLRDAFSESTSRWYQPHELRQARSSQALRQASSPSSHQPASNNTVIYDGFDFGFNNNPTPTTIHTTSPSSRGMMARPPSPTPSDASSVCSLSLSGSSSDDSLPLEEEEMGLCLGLAPAPAPRPRAHPRPCLDGGAGSGNDAEYFIRRGGWKRRGIVFVNSEAPLAGEDETFEI